MMNVIILNVIMLSVIMLCGIMLSVIMPNVVAPKQEHVTKLFCLLFSLMTVGKARSLPKSGTIEGSSLGLTPALPANI
jgi:hypothetical protein